MNKCLLFDKIKITMKFRIKNLLNDKDIVPNIIDTYPAKALLAQTEDEFYDYLFENEYNVLCYHITRITLQEKNNIKNCGLSFGSKELLLSKVKNLPLCCDWFKAELINHIENLYETQADNLICASYGYLDLVKDSACDNIFHTNWGGESIYNYFDHGNNFDDEHLRKIHETLQKISYPCLIVLRVSISTFYNSDYYRLFDKLMQSCDKEKISGSLYIKNILPEVVEIVDLNTYNGIDFS